MTTIRLLERPLPRRQVATELTRRILESIHADRPAPGTPLATEAQLVRDLKLSRSTVRRALEPLQRDGWIERRAGVGTAIGRRVLELPVAPAADRALVDGQLKARRSRGILRAAVLIYNIGDLSHDWYTPRILRGIDEAADAHRVAIERLGDRDRDVDAITRRLDRSRPDVLICLSHQPRDAFVIRDAQRMGIHCILSGTPHRGLGLPSVVEDNRHAIEASVRHLHEHGHRRIALAIQLHAEPWVMERHQAFLDVQKRLDLPDAGGMVLSIDAREGGQGSPRALEAMAGFLRATRASAVVLGSLQAHQLLARLSAAGKLRIPQDVSAITFERSVDALPLGPHAPTRYDLPLEAMGRRLAECARRLVDGKLCDLEQSLRGVVETGGTVATNHRKVSPPIRLRSARGTDTIMRSKRKV